MKCTFVVAFLCCFSQIYAKYTSLGSSDWSLNEVNNQYQVSGVTVPGGIYTDLMKAGIVPDCLYYKNNVECRKFGNMDWIYSKYFDFDSNEIAKSQKILLIVDGIDTKATLTLNGQEIGGTENMYRRYTFDITGKLKDKGNKLEVKIISPVTYGRSQAKTWQETFGYELQPSCWDPEQDNECRMNFVRRVRMTSGLLPSLGIWKPIGIETVSEPVLKDFSALITQKPDGDWSIKTKLRIYKSNDATVRIKVELDGQEVYNNVAQLSGDYFEVSNELPEIVIPKDSVSLWWPNGMGYYENGRFVPYQRKLYNLKVSLMSNDYSQWYGDKQKKIGFRKLELVQEKVSQWTDGLTFQFRVNGEPLFIKGSNFIPISIFPEKTYDMDEVKYLFESAVHSHQNMIRVWGGGVYESDELYELADEMGLLIWQDFMFVCFSYPSNKEFLDNVEVEVRQQMDRLKHHPSIAIWAGNNENEQAISAPWWEPIKQRPEDFKRDYIKLYIDTIYRIVKEEDPSRTFVPSSPSNGDRSLAEGGMTSGDPGSIMFGDMHYYDYENDPWEASHYPKGRFISEYGFQAHPSYETYAKYIPEDQLYYPGSEALHLRQMQYLEDGDAKLDRMVQYHFYPPSHGDKTSLKKYIYLTQVVQTEGSKVQSEVYLRRRNLDPNNGQEMTWGSLYWQLNDQWQGPTWASVEFGGKWKMWHYWATQTWKPINAHAFVEGDWAKISVVSDINSTVPVLVIGSVHRFSNFDSVELYRDVVWLNPYESRQVWAENVNDIVYKGQCEWKDNCIMRIRYKLLDPSGKGDWSQPNEPYPDSLDTENHCFLGSPKSSGGVDQVNVWINSISKTDQPNRFKIELQSDKLALFTWIDFKMGSNLAGHFSENGFMMFEPKKVIWFDSYNPSTNENDLRNNLEITTLDKNMY